MRMSSLLFVFAAGLVGPTCVFAGQHVETPRADGASTPLAVYEPSAAGKGCAPLALISHGAGGSERGLRYLGEALARDGWRAIVVGHRESGLGPLATDIRSDGFKQGIADLVTNVDAYRKRFMDIDAAHAWANKTCRAPYVALLGHSMGAITVMLEAGAQNKLGLKARGGFNAYVALSPEGPGQVFPTDAWRPISAPMLLITGTRDRGLDGDYTWRTQAYDGLGPGCRWLAVVDGASHMDFGGARSTNARVETATTTLIVRYLDSLRRGHCASSPQLDGVALRTK
ncbi:alpha/beta hydrolase [Rudaea sp.]|uniref:alpha/beta hydrolase family protein n=1 Tax=Rudaea sp. TaxID=2136325 RepID=UPI002ED472E1